MGGVLPMFYFRTKYIFPVILSLGIAALAAVMFLGESRQVFSETENVRTVSTVVIDAGHGGDDGGTVGRSGTVEKDINLEIALMTRRFCDYLGVDTVLTREADVSLGTGDTLREKKVSDLKNRVELVRSIEGAALISIHQNYYDDRESRGAQVFYREGNLWGKALALRMQDDLACISGTENTRRAMPLPNGNYMLENLDCPAIIVECGFLSHLEEEMLLNSPEYRGKLAFAVAAEALRCVSEGVAAG